MKKSFAIIMSVLMTFCFMPAAAFANPTQPPATNSTVVAKIGNTEYTDLHEALEEAKDGDTVDIINDCTISPVEIGPDEEENAWTEGITIEGNGHTITGWDKTDEYGSAIDVIYSKVIFNDIKFEDFACGNTDTNMWAAAIVGYSGCDITVTNCSFKNFNRQAIDFSPRYKAGKMTVTGCTFDCTPFKESFTIQKAMIIGPKLNGSVVEVKDCEISHAGSYNEPKWSTGGIEIFGGTVTVEDCEIIDCEMGVVASREYWDAEDGNADHVITLKNTSISARTAAVWLDCYKEKTEGGTSANITIESGYYKGRVGIGKSGEATDEDLKKCSISLTGGYYSDEPDAKYIAGGYYVDASNISGYPYEVRQGSKPENSTIVIVKDKTTPSISDRVTELTDEDRTAINSKTKVEGVTEAVAGSKDTLVEKSGIDTAAGGVDKVNVKVEVKVELTAAEFSDEKQAMTYTATPVATVTTTSSAGETLETRTNVEVPNSLLSGELITVKLPLHENFDLKQIRHTSSDGYVEYFLKTPTRGAKTFTIDENNCAIFTISKFSTFELSGTVTYVAPSKGGYYKPVDKAEDKTEDKEEDKTATDASQISAEQAAKVKELAKKIQLKARSVKTAKGNIKVRLKITKDADSFRALEDMGYTLKYQFYRSTEIRKNYRYKFETLGAPYTNTDAKKGTRYYYKARIVVYDREGNLITKTDLKRCWYATRIR